VGAPGRIDLTEDADRQQVKATTCISGDYCSLHNLAHLAGLEMPEPLPRQLSTRLVPSLIEENRVRLRIEAACSTAAA
jgi:hypothetical protein